MSLSLKKRVTIMDETIVFLKSLITEIEFSKMSIIKILSVFSKEDSMKSLTYLHTFSECNDYSDFRVIWKKGISSFSYYKSVEKDKMLQLGSLLGTTDVNNQISTIKLFLSFFETYRNTALSEYEKHGKTSPLLGLFAGASVFILLL